ncbi:MAG: RNA polymerase sigma factor [Acidimicrobiia bacterium]|nr:RNA polymerase sigma factor [Acidimicrobiia bacterium]
MSQSPSQPTGGSDDQPAPDAEAEDRALVARIARGDRSALEQLFRRHAPWLTARLEYRCGDPDLADIALQDTFVAVWRSAKKYRAQGSVAAWLWGIAIRRLIDQLRRRRPIPLPTEHLAALTGPAGGGRSGAVTFEDHLTQQAAFSELGPALQELHPDLRAVLIATAIDGLTTREAARLLGVPQGTVKTRLMRARKALQEALS